MFVLKEYQQRALDALSTYFDACLRMGDADTAYYQTTRSTFGRGIAYTPVKELPGLPYVCVRIPTGGGKTVIACHAVGIALQRLLQADHGVILWLVPSNAIREQTLQALSDRAHPYRQAVQSATGSSVTVLDVKDALYVQPSTLATDTTIIVSTMQAFRVENTEGRHVYESAGMLEGHFVDAPLELMSTLECRSDGSVRYSLANVLRMHRPVVIVDEAHNARTSLSFETLARFNPSCIVELTATPDTATNPSNIVHSVSAAELKAEAMIKIPIQLETRPNWKELLADAIGLRSRLEQSARLERQETSEYIRPIMLIQAQPRRKAQDTVTVDVVRECLISDYNLPESQIKRATAEMSELDNLNLSDPSCDVRFIITVQALREGWDCPFAYVLYSVAEMTSATAVEQILGRVMRLPNATPKVHTGLNMAYAFAASENFAATANALTDALVQNGFNRQEARELVTHEPFEQLSFQEPNLLTGITTVPLSETPKVELISQHVAERITFDTQTGTMTYSGVMNDGDREELERCFTTSEGKKAVGELCRKSRSVSPTATSPAERGELFEIPILSVKQGNLFEPFEATYYMETPWDLSTCDALLTEGEFPSGRSQGQHGEISVSDAGRVEMRFILDLHQQMTLLASDEGWSVSELAYWLDNKIPHPDIVPAESGLFLVRLVRSLIDERGLSLDSLVHEKYRLKEAVGTKIDEYRREAYNTTYQALLLDDSPIAVTPERCFSFKPASYPYSTLYQGAYKFRNHYYPQVGDLKVNGEEFECAQYIDSLPEVKFWVRNLERRPTHAFWLQTSTDKFYPDFVCLLKDGRYLVVEYKGEDRWSNDDSKEKRDIGGLWEKRSGGNCLFIMPKGSDLQAIKDKVRV